MKASDIPEATQLLAQNEHYWAEQKRISECNHLTFAMSENGYRFEFLAELVPEVKTAYINALSARINANNNKLRDMGVEV